MEVRNLGLRGRQKENLGQKMGGGWFVYQI